MGTSQRTNTSGKSQRKRPLQRKPSQRKHSRARKSGGSFLFPTEQECQEAFEARKNGGDKGKGPLSLYHRCKWSRRKEYLKHKDPTERGLYGLFEYKKRARLRKFMKDFPVAVDKDSEPGNENFVLPDVDDHVTRRRATAKIPQHEFERLRLDIMPALRRRIALEGYRGTHDERLEAYNAMQNEVGRQTLDPKTRARMNRGVKNFYDNIERDLERERKLYERRS